MAMPLQGQCAGDFARGSIFMRVDHINLSLQLCMARDGPQAPVFVTGL
jgi:hypothetical protein